MTEQVMLPRTWRLLSEEEKQQRLEDLRRRQQEQIEAELRYLPLRPVGH